MLDVQADQHQGWAAEQACHGSGAAGNSLGIELLTCAQFDHAVKFFEIEARMLPVVREVEGLEQDEHFCRRLAHRRFGGHDRLVESGPDFNPHQPISWPRHGQLRRFRRLPKAAGLPKTGLSGIAVGKCLLDGDADSSSVG